MSRAVLATSDLVKSFGPTESGVEVLSGVTTSFTQGQTVAITGVSGTGKSTFMHLLAGIDTPTSGTVTYNGKNLSQLTEQERTTFFGQAVGLVFQSPHLISELSVVENVMLPGLVRKESSEECRQRAQSLLAAVGLAEKADGKPASLSGGQQQRVALARALFCKPAFLLADELTGNLDGQRGAAVVDLLIELQREMKMGIVLSTHDTQVAGRMQEVYRLAGGALSRV